MTDLAGLDPYLAQYVAETRAALEAPYLLAAMRRIVPIFLAAREADRTIFFFGNGGSASTASHFVIDIAKSTRRNLAEPAPRRFRCIALNDNIPGITAWANDAAYDRIFAEPLRNLAVRGDVAVAISGSGNSPNVLAAVAAARELGVTTIGLTGMGGGKLKEMVDVPVIVPSNSMQHTEDVHLILLHLLTAYLRDEQPPAPR